MKKSKTGFLTKNNIGFTVFEIIVVIAIMAILSLIVFTNYRSGETRNLLRRAAQKITLDIRSAQSMAMSAKEIEGFPQGVPPGGYGVEFETNRLSYIFYGDSGNMFYDSSDVLIKEIPLENGVKICSLSSAPLSINFTPPDPTITFLGGNPTATITICLEEDESKTKAITINKAGMIDFVE